MSHTPLNSVVRPAIRKISTPYLFCIRVFSLHTLCRMPEWRVVDRVIGFSQPDPFRPVRLPAPCSQSSLEFCLSGMKEPTPKKDRDSSSLLFLDPRFAIRGSHKKVLTSSHQQKSKPDSYPQRHAPPLILGWFDDSFTLHGTSLKGRVSSTDVSLGWLCECGCVRMGA